MRHCAIAATLMLTTSAPVLAQNFDALRDGLNNLPAALMVEERGDLAYFLDLQTILALDDGTSSNRPFFRAIPSADINALNSLTRSDPGEWEAKAGTSVDKVRYFTGHGVPPDVHSQWGLIDEAAATDMITTLEALGFEDAGEPDVLGNGEPRQMDPAQRDPSDPWRTMIGAAQFAAAKGSNIVQAQTPQAAMLVAAPHPSLGDTPIIETAVGGLEHISGDSQVVQAVLISPIFGMKGLDPAVFLSQPLDMDEVRQRIESQTAELSTGIPPYAAGLVADLQGDRPGVGIALVYPDCAVAQTAVDALASRWTDMAGEAAQGEISTQTREGADGLCAASLSVFVESETLDINPAYRAIIEPHMRGEAGVLQIGES